MKELQKVGGVGKIGILGIALTALYLLGWGTLVYLRSDKFAGMELNAIGDFLGGSFAPLAFLWLVLGFFQQGIELRQNSDALHLQAEELRQSVEQQRSMVDIAGKELHANLQHLELQMSRLREEQEEAERASRPLFVFKADSHGSIGSEGRAWDFMLSNAGADCSNLTFTLSNTSSLQIGPGHLHFLSRGQEPVRLRFWGKPERGMVTSLEIEYLDVRGNPWRGTWNVSLTSEQLLEITSANGV